MKVVTWCSIEQLIVFDDLYRTESLPEEIQEGEYFQKLTVLDYDFPVSQLALSTIWNVDELSTDQYMEGEKHSFTITELDK